jgi:hypothetical protein
MSGTTGSVFDRIHNSSSRSLVLSDSDHILLLDTQVLEYQHTNEYHLMQRIEKAIQ